MQLYDDFSKSQAQKKVEEELGEGEVGVADEADAPPTTHIFQVLAKSTAIRGLKTAFFFGGGGGGGEGGEGGSHTKIYNHPCFQSTCSCNFGCINVLRHVLNPIFNQL